MDNVTSTYTKSRLVKELSFKTGISQVKAKLALDTLRDIICREAATSTFILPGICKFETVIRKERRMRNPRTGASLILPEHKVLRLTPAKVIREAVAPRVSTVAAPPEPVKEEPAAAPVVAAAPAPVPVAEPVKEEPASAPVVAAAPAPAPVAEPVKEEPAPVDDFILPGTVPVEEPVASPAPVPEPQAAPAEAPASAEELPDITFHCPSCGQEIEAPGDMAGMEAECPMCGHLMRVPSANPSGTASSGQKVVSASEAEAIDPRLLKSKTIRIDAIDLDLEERGPAGQAVQENMISFFCPGCHQEIEATVDMAGTVSECPNCGTEFEVPFFSEKGTVHAESEELFDPRKVEQQKHKTMRIDLDDF